MSSESAPIPTVTTEVAANSNITEEAANTITGTDATEANGHQDSTCNKRNSRDDGGGKRKKKRNKRNRNWHDFPLKQSPSSVCMWVGQIPAQHASNRALTGIFQRSVPENIYAPVLRRLVQRAYKRNGELFAYAIVLFRDQAEADIVKNLWNGKEIAPGFIPELKESTASVEDKVSMEGDAEQIAASINLKTLVSALPKDSLDQLCKQHNITVSDNGEDDKRTKVSLFPRVLEYYENLPEETQTHSGVPVPEHILSKLTQTLDNLRWPPASHRRAVHATSYLVLRGDMLEGLYSGLVADCKELMDWAGDDSFKHSAIAVTRNFQGSPHIDHRDQTYQYALSLGSFTSGGELCVAEFLPDKRVTHVVDTRGKLARVDGRYVHWVQPADLTGGVRYSLIFYNTDESGYTPIRCPFDPDFKPAGSE